MKKCSQCGIEKQDDSFYKKKNVCKECYCSNCKEWRNNNREKTRKYCRDHYWDNPEKSRKRVLDWQKSNPDVKNKLNNNWMKNNLDKYKKMMKKWRDANRELILKSKKLSNSRRRDATKGKITIEEWNECLRKYGNKCLCCGKDDVKITIDHVIPIHLGGKNCIENVQPLCASCNSRKGIKIIDYRQ